MVYSALTSGSGLASGAASLASGALTSIRRNDLVTAASELLGAAESSHETGVKWVFDYYDDWDADYSTVNTTRPGIDKVKPQRWCKYALQID